MHYMKNKIASKRHECFSMTRNQLEEDMVAPLTTNVCITHRAALTIACMWCHFQQCPWEIGSVWAERVRQGEVGWCTHTKAWLCLGLAAKNVQTFFRHIPLYTPGKQSPYLIIVYRLL